MMNVVVKLLVNVGGNNVTGASNSDRGKENGKSITDLHKPAAPELLQVL